MHDLKQAWCICRMTCEDYMTTLRFWVIISFAAIMGFATLDPVTSAGNFIEVILTSLSFLGYILIISALLAFLGRAPYFTQNDQFLISRASRKTWIWGKLIFIAIVLLVLYLLMFLVILLADYQSISANLSTWTSASDDLDGMYKFTSIGKPLLAEDTPIQVFLIFMPLSYLLLFILSLIILLFNVWGKRMLGMIVLVSILAVSGGISFGMEQFARLGLVMHAIPYFHQVVGYTGQLRYNSESILPTVPESVVLFIVLTALLLYLVTRAIKRYDFHQHNKED